MEVLEHRWFLGCVDAGRRGGHVSGQLVGRWSGGRARRARLGPCVPAATAQQPREKAPPRQELLLGSGLVQVEVVLTGAGGLCSGLDARLGRRPRAAAALLVDSRRPAGEGSDRLGLGEVRLSRLALDVVTGGRLGRDGVHGVRLGLGPRLGAGLSRGVEGSAGLSEGGGRVRGRACRLAGRRPRGRLRR